jgi:putative acetyltransferase
MKNPPRGLKLRAARPTDAESLAELFNQPGFRWGTAQMPFQSPEHIQTRLDKNAPGVTHILAEIEETIIGSAVLDRFTGRRTHAGGIGMGVHDAWTGQGIGTALMTALLDTADNWMGLQRLELTVYTDNAPALALYQRFGFTIEGTYRYYAFRAGKLVDAHGMARVRS